MLALLGLLAFLQYRWLGQISDGERERLTRTVKADTERFSEDFNREIQNAYFNFQINAKIWRDKNWKEFNDRYDFYREKTEYPELIKDFYFVGLGENPTLLKYREGAREFSNADWNDELNKLKPKLAGENFNSINEEMPALLIPVHEITETVERIIIRTKNTENIQGVPKKLSKKIGVLVIELDRQVIENKILPDLAKKYFSENESADYNLSVVNKNNSTIFQKGEVGKPDASAKIFNISPDKFVFFANREMLPRTAGEQKKSIVLNRIESTSDVEVLPGNEEKKVDVKIINSEQTASETKPRIQMLEGQLPDAAGVWTLNVQHSAGSLEQFITNTRNKNLAISFSILSLLALSIILIFISSQRAKLFAQRQVDFVSSVSHEFRTPLAVIYSAGENLSDGVIRDENKINEYGNLIKREGKKLSTMVEQILEFAGAKSGGRKFDFQIVEVKKIIDEAIAECQPLIEENGFTIEKEIAENLPEISGDKRALTQAVQNLIANSIKYSDGEKFIKISAQNGSNKIKISVEDRGLGIGKNELGKVFEPFYRSKKVVDAQIHGNGLGLSLVKQIAEAHGGKVKVESESGKGSKFTI
ncbi:MAG: HAMP domain-containing sensor histidine kinase, partial [Pyrinomonadaceae bacterium]